MTAQKSVIGFIGLGYMGHGMAANILKNGYPLIVKGHRNRQAIEDLLSRGAQEAETPRLLAEASDIVHLCLSNSPQVEAIIRGPDGILASSKRGLIVIDCGTSDPVSTEALAAELADAGMTLVDAPLGRTPKEAEAGTLDTMVGADQATFDKILPVLQCWAANIQHLGSLGSGHKMKLLMNFIGMGYASLYSEGLAVAVRVGLTPQAFHRVIGSSRMSNGFFETFMRYAIERDKDAHKFSINNAHKDMRYCSNMATSAGAVNMMGSVIKNYFAHAEAIGKGDDFVPMLADHVAALNGVDLGAAVAEGEKQ